MIIKVQGKDDKSMVVYQKEGNYNFISYGKDENKCIADICVTEEQALAIVECILENVERRKLDR